MITKQQNVEFLISTPINYRCTNLAEHLDGVSHDAITDYLSHARLTARHVWQMGAGLIQDGPDAFLIVDHSVQNKRYSQQMALVKRQYNGTEHGLGRGGGVVNLVQSSGEPGAFSPIDYRIDAPEMDGKTKNAHFREMYVRALADKCIQARRVLSDSWYAAAENLKLIHRTDRFFYTTRKANRMVSVAKPACNVIISPVVIMPRSRSSCTRSGCGKHCIKHAPRYSPRTCVPNSDFSPLPPAKRKSWES